MGEELPLWLDDRLLTGTDARELATVSVHDAGLRSGLGVFETFRAHGVATLAGDRHVARLLASAERLGIRIGREQVERALDLTLSAPRRPHEVVVRITLTAGPVATDTWPALPVGTPTLVVALHPAPALPLPPACARTVEARRWPADVKSTSYLASMLALREARAAGADTAVLRDRDELLESAEGNLVAVVDGGLVTPPADGRILSGVTRALVLEEGRRIGLRCSERPLRSADVDGAEALVVTSAVSGLRTVRELDGRRVAGSDADGAPHPAVAELRALLEQRRG